MEQPTGMNATSRLSVRFLTEWIILACVPALMHGRCQAAVQSPVDNRYGITYVMHL